MDKKFKIIIGVLSAAVAVLAIVLIYVWIDRNSYINELTIDKENLTAEMLQLQEEYAQLSSTNDTLNNEILLEREKVAQLIERVQKTEATNKAMLRKYEKELGTLRSIMRNYIKQIDSLNTLNITLRAEAAEAKQQARESKDRYENLKSTTEELGKQVELGSIVKGRASSRPASSSSHSSSSSSHASSAADGSDDASSEAPASSNSRPSSSSSSASRGEGEGTVNDQFVDGLFGIVD